MEIDISKYIKNGKLDAAYALEEIFHQEISREILIEMLIQKGVDKDKINSLFSN